MKKMLIAALLMIVSLVLPGMSSALDTVEPPGKDWEYNFGVGYKDFTEKGISSSAYLAARAQKRIAYPFLVGLGVEGSVVGDVWEIEANLPVTARLPLYNSLKLDVVVAPGVAYARNTNAKISKVMGVGTGGIELKHFVKKGTSIGLGVYYSVLTKKEFNNFKIGLVIGF